MSIYHRNIKDWIALYALWLNSRIFLNNNWSWPFIPPVRVNHPRNLKLTIMRSRRRVQPFKKFLFGGRKLSNDLCSLLYMTIVVIVIVIIITGKASGEKNEDLGMAH